MSNLLSKKLCIPKNLMKEIFVSPLPSLETFDYDKYWESRVEEDGDSQTDLDISREIKEGSSVCDLGCGNCHLLEYLIKHKNIRAFGVDISQKALSICTRKKVANVQADFSKCSFILKKKFDYILICDVLEHLPNPENLLTNIKNNYRSKVIVTVPNIAYFPNRIKMLIGKFPSAWVIHPAEHLRYWSVSDFKFWINNVVKDYEIEKIYPDRGVAFLRNLLPNLFATGIVVVLRKKNDYK